MEVRRTLIGNHPTPLIEPIPDSCVRDRTITLNKLKILQIFPDRRPTAQAWINDNIPRIFFGDSEKLVKWFWTEMPSNGWLEFDFGKKTLHLCTLEKK
jgi:hypothetical protein